MQCRRSVLCGFAVIIVLTLLSTLTYILYQSSGQCPQGTFPCKNSTICLPQRYMCNSHADCPFGEDEDKYACVDIQGIAHIWDIVRQIKEPQHECRVADKPRGCVCTNKTWLICKFLGLTEVPQEVSTSVTRLVLANNSINNLNPGSFKRYKLDLIHLGWNQISDIPVGVFEGQNKLTRLLLTNNNLTEIRPGVLRGLRQLEWLVLQDNNIADIDLDDLKHLNLSWLDFTRNNLTLHKKSFPELPHLKQLVLDENSIEYIGEKTFQKLISLESLYLNRNRIRYIHPKAFSSLSSLTVLDLSYNNLRTLPSTVFRNLTSLRKLTLAENPIKVFTLDLFSSLKNLRSLDLREVEIENIDVQMFSPLSELNFVYFKKFYYCTYAPLVRICKPNTDGVSSLKHLLVKPVLRVTVWVVAAMTCLGNSMVLWGRFSSRDENRVLSLVIRNLAVSDMLMGVYLLVIGTQDSEYRDIYHKEAHNWMSSWKCTVIGVIAMTSSEVSILILVFMSLERFLLIAVPFSGYQNMTMRTTRLSLLFIWLTGLSLAAIPVFYWWNSTRFYGTNGMCFPLHIDDPFLLGWEYSAFIFLGINTIGLILIAVLYTWMFVSIWQTRHATPISSVGDFEFVIRFFFIVLTDAGCWAPIIALKVLAFSRVHISTDLYAWVVVFILPVNSAVNPLLYTFTTPKYRGQLFKFGWPQGSQRNLVIRRPSTADTDCSRSSTNRNMVACSLTGHKKSLEGNLYSMLPVMSGNQQNGTIPNNTNIGLHSSVKDFILT